MGWDEAPCAISPIFGDGAELLDRLLRSFPFLGVKKAMIDMIVDQGPFRAGDRILDRLELLSDVDAGAMVVDHRDDAVEMAGGAFEPLHDRRMRAVRVVNHSCLTSMPSSICRALDISPQGDKCFLNISPLGDSFMADHHA